MRVRINVNSRNNSKIKHEIRATSASCLSELKARQSSKIGKIRQALVAAGFDTTTKQAAVLGLAKSTTWRYCGAITKAPDCLHQSSTACCARRNYRRLYGE